jgi:hypothetical protein
LRMKPVRFPKSAISFQPGTGKNDLPGKRYFVLVFFCFLLLMQGCASLLPSSKEVTKSRWNNFDQAKSAYEKIIPNRTTLEDLKELGFNSESTPNITIMNYLDVAKAVQPIRKQDLDTGLAVCLDAKDACRAYEFELKNLSGKRYGNFWLDLLNFRRNTRLTGWKFNSLIVIVNDIVTYKVWSGNPHVEETVEQKNPLGPLQDGTTLRLLIPY